MDTKYGLLPPCRKLSLLFNPERDIHPVAAEMTGLSREYLKQYPTFDQNADIILDFLDQLQKPICLVAHNGNVFDFKLLTTEFENAGKWLPSDILCADSLQGFRKILTDNPIDYRSFDAITVDDILTDDEDEEFPELNISKEDWSEINKLSGSFSNVSIESSSSGGNKSLNISNVSLGTVSSAGNNSVNKSEVSIGSSPSVVSKKGPFILSTVYKRLLNKEPKNAHRAEADCVMLMECVVTLKDQFLPWADVCCKRMGLVKPFVPF